MKKPFKFFLGLLFFPFFAKLVYDENSKLTKTQISYVNKKIPSRFDGYKIVQISDLHNKLFGKRQKKLLDEIHREFPDIVVVTGDIYYSYKNTIKNSLLFLQEIAKSYPVYFVTGNHEQRDPLWNIRRQQIQSYGIHMLDNRIEKIYLEEDYIQLYGLKDPSFYPYSVRYSLYEHHLKKLQSQLHKDHFSLLLAHRPEKFDLYVKHKVDLALCGHAHGGQIRLGGQGLISPGEGFFPKYTAGLYQKKVTSMIVSRGLGRTIFTSRVFNRPDIVCVTLQSK